jgi:hypothetical protein
MAAAPGIWVVTVPYRRAAMLVGNHPDQGRDGTVTVQARNRTMLAWLLFAATFACWPPGWWSPWPWSGR